MKRAVNVQSKDRLSVESERAIPAATKSISLSKQTNKGFNYMKLNSHLMSALLLTGAFALTGQDQALAGAPKSKVKTSLVRSKKILGAGGMEVVTAATGGEAIPASNAGGTWTTLTGPVITETFARDTGGPGLGTIVLNIPPGFEFNPDSQVSVLVNADGPKIINGVADGGTIPATVTSTSITLDITSVSRGGLAYPDKLTFQNIQVRPTAGNVLASGNLTESGTCLFRDLTLSSGTWGLLQEVGGAIPNVILADPLGDWDGDGRSNLIEYALGTDPTNPTDNQEGMNIWITNDSGNNYLAIGFKQRTTAGLPLQYMPEVSGDKQVWYSDAAHILSLSVAPVDGQFNWVTCRDTVPLTPSTPRFIRLTVIQN